MAHQIKRTVVPRMRVEAVEMEKELLQSPACPQSPAPVKSKR